MKLMIIYRNSWTVWQRCCCLETEKWIVDNFRWSEATTDRTGQERTGQDNEIKQLIRLDRVSEWVGGSVS